VFQIEPTGDIYDVPFRWAKSKVGTLDQPVSEMVANRQKQIEASFVCFQDEKCMKCPVIGFCWGGCVTGLPMNNGKPSEHCNQERLIAIVNKMAAEGEIVKQTDRQKTVNILDSVVGRRIPLECLSN
jgi:radical SAM protein with 4Fe4S-binding SPASM domain